MSASMIEMVEALLPHLFRTQGPAVSEQARIAGEALLRLLDTTFPVEGAEVEDA